MAGMDHGNMKMEGHDMSMYDLFTLNGKSGDLVEPLKVNKGDKVRLRLVNAGYLSHNIHVHGHDIKVIATDGQPINDPKVIKDKVISIARVNVMMLSLLLIITENGMLKTIQKIKVQKE